LGLGAAGCAGTKLAQKAFGDGIKCNKKKSKTYGWTRNKIQIIKNEKNSLNFRGVFATDVTKKN
jgi:hypothetical protein